MRHFRLITPLILATTVLGGCALRPGGRPPVRAAETSAQRTIVYHNNLQTRQDGPYLFELDSGVVYRIELIGDPAVIELRHRQSERAPLRFASVIEGRGMGEPFMAPESGTYQLTSRSDEGGQVLVRITRDASDQASQACVRNPRAEGCRGAGGIRPASIVMAILFVPPAILIWQAGY
jgi:hypothetical protein